MLKGWNKNGIMMMKDGENICLEGPYGLICLGLRYLFHKERNRLELDSFVLVEVDMKYRVSVELPLYEDMFRVSAGEVYEENGKHYITRRSGKKLEILNYDMLRIPDVLKAEEASVNHYHSGTVRRLIPPEPEKCKYTVNTCCKAKHTFDDNYLELYACMLDYDPETKEGAAVGFDSLGKIIAMDWKCPVEKLWDEIISKPLKNYNYKDWEKEYYQSLGFLNFMIERKEDGTEEYRYTPIW